MKKYLTGKFWPTAAVVTPVLLYLFFRMLRKGHHTLISQAGEDLLKDREQVWNHYPRPQMRRESYVSLNGNWRLNGQKVLVPFPPQSLLSGYQGRVGTHLEYRRNFEAPPGRAGRRVLLHFGAVDQIAEVYLNDRYVGKHEGGYLPFSFDITEYVTEGKNRLLVKAKDTLSPRYPYGKQRKNRGGMWYTPVSGIWQSVWLECVPETYIQKLDVAADSTKVCVSVTGNGDKDGEKAREISVTILLHDGSPYTVQSKENRVEIDLSLIRLADGEFYQPVLWTTERPYLYEMTVTMGEDRVSSYFGLRTVEIRKFGDIPRVCLNGEPVFLHGVLDQGYFCDGIYLPAKEEEYEQDVLRMKELGINLLRKHIKIEPECFYYYCDLHGMLVMQDMVNNGPYSWIRDTALPTLGIYAQKNFRFRESRQRKEFFMQHMRETIRHLRNHPCVIAYTLFNEGWGQFESDAAYEEARRLDDTRLYDATSGWFPQTESDFDSQHIYFRKLHIPEKPEKPVLISECGGYSFRVPGHFYSKYMQYGYGGCADGRKLTERILALYEGTVLPGIPEGVCGCVYTQLSDVEDETNGLYTYDRRVCKAEPEALRELSQKLRRKLSTAIGGDSGD